MSINEMLMASAGSGGGDKLYVEDCFATHLYTGNGSTQTINNGIDLAGKGGMVWTKSRSTARANNIVDTVRGGDNMLYTNTTDAQFSLSGLGFSSFSFNSSGYSASNATVDAENGATFASWTFRKQPKFFDVVTYTGNGTARTIAHNLGSVPGMIIVKSTSDIDNWAVYHRSLATNQWLQLNTTSAVLTSTTVWNNTAPTASVFSVGTAGVTNANGATFVAYLFAHDAGGFGDAGTDNIISCGSYTGNGSSSGPVVTLGYEPQYLMIKNASGTGNWFVMDNMRGMPLSGDTAILKPNTSEAEDANQGHAVDINATGFQITSTYTGTNGSGSTYIYMAIRRPMKKPTSGTQVFSPVAYTTNNDFSQIISLGFNADMVFTRSRTATSSYESQGLLATRLIGTKPLRTTQTAGDYFIDWGKWDVQNGVDNTIIAGIGTQSAMLHGFRRAPGFFDVVCYTGTGSSDQIPHNLGVVPELIITKRRNGTSSWFVDRPLNTTAFNQGALESTAAFYDNWLPSGMPATATTFRPSQIGSGQTFVAYLFATLAGVSKVGSYTGNGSSQTINCGFSAGARFVLIKRTDSTGDWCVFDTARGIVSGNDPFLQLNSTAAEVTGEDAVDPANSGFIVNETTENLNVNNATYIYLAIA